MRDRILFNSTIRVAHRWLFRLGLAFLLVFAGAQSHMRADSLIVSSLNGYIYQVDTSTNTTTTLLNTYGAAVDSLIFAPGNKIVFSLPDQGEIRILNTVTHDTKYVFGFNEPVDIALEPSGTSVLVSDYGQTQVARVDLTATYPHPVYLSNYLDNIDGITYDNAGDLFVVQSWQGYVAQISPTDGTILRRLRCPGCYGGYQEMDGMTFDPSTGDLWVSSLTWNGLVEFNTQLTSSKNFAIGEIRDPDGVEADGNGNIFVASKYDDHIYEYNIASGITTQLTYVPGLDDIAPLTGLGGPPPTTTPEASTLLMVCTGLLGLAGTVKRRLFS